MTDLGTKTVDILGVNSITLDVGPIVGVNWSIGEVNENKLCALAHAFDQAIFC